MKMKPLLLFLLLLASVITTCAQQKIDTSERKILRQKVEVLMHYVDSLRDRATVIFTQYERDSANLLSARKKLQIVQTGHLPDKKAKTESLNKQIVVLDKKLKKAQMDFDDVLIRLDSSAGKLHEANERLAAADKGNK